jgi:two-component system, cell cycle sensor histidine kinase and response regulator CckA
MMDTEKSKDQLIQELKELRRTVLELKNSGRERKKPEKALLESREIKKVLFNTPNDVIGFIDLDGFVIDGNETAAKRLGKPLDELVGMCVWDLLPPETVRSRKAFVDQVIRSGEPARFEDERNGVWFDNVVYPICDEEGKVVRIALIARDITERKQAEEELRHSTMLIDTIVENIPDMIFLKDAEALRFVRFNRAGEDLLGYSRKDLLGKSDYDFFPADQAAFFTENDREVLRRNEILDIPSEPIQTRNKGERILHTQKVPILNGKGEPEYLLGISEDITERKRAEDARRASEEKYRGIFDEAVVAIYVFDHNKKFVDTNQAGLDLLGYSREELLLMRIPDVDADPVAVLPAHQDLLAGGRLINYEHKLRRKDGAIISVLNNSRSLTDEKGQVIGMLSTLMDITESKRIEADLRESERKYRLIADNVTDVIWTMDVKFNFNYISPSVTKLRGLTAQEALAQSLSDFITPASLEVVLKAIAEEENLRIQKPLETDRRLTIELEQFRKDGSTVWTENEVSYIHDNEQKMIGIVGVTRDISERKRMEIDLRKSEAKFRAVVENIFDGVIFTDDQGMITYRSPSLERITGFTDEDRLQHSGFDNVHPEDMDFVVQKMGACLKQPNSPVHGEFRIRHINGSWRWVDTTAQNLLHHPDIRQLILIHHDVTDRKKTEEELKEREEKYRALFERGPFGVVILDPETTQPIEFNDQVCKQLGYTRNEFARLKMSDIDAVENSDETRERIQKVMEEGYGEFETLQRTKTGEIINILVVAQHIETSNGFVYHCIWWDITDRKKGEIEKKNLEERLQRAEKMEALGTLAGGVAHDLNNVLGIIVGYSEMTLYDLEATSPLRPALESIMGGSQKAAAIVQDLLTLARRGIADRRVANLNVIVAECQYSPEFKGLSSLHPALIVKIDLEPDLLNIAGSSVHLGKTLFNLITNAAEAMPKGGTVTIKTSNQYLDKPIRGYDEVREGDYVVLSVTDTGEGIAPQDLKRIFEPFYTKKVMGRSGTGLGLAVVWGTVKDHLGYIDVTSEEGKGSAFSLYFPVTREEMAAREKAVSIAEYIGKGESILVIDDVKGQRDLAENMLKKLNYQISTVPSGEAAVHYLKDHPVDLLVLDMIMDPGMDGLDTYRKILEIHPRQKAVIVSGFSESDRVRAAQALGAGVYVKKPYVLKKLGLAVRRELDR